MLGRITASRSAGRRAPKTVLFPTFRPGAAHIEFLGMVSLDRPIPRRAQKCHHRPDDAEWGGRFVIPTVSELPGGRGLPGGSVGRRRRMQRWCSDERGTASVEFILIAPFLLLIMFASVELSRAWFTMNLLTTAAREAVKIGRAHV